METYCCEDMRREIERVCDQHPDRFDCPDCLVGYSPRFREYGLLIHDGGSSWMCIRYCPWCGSLLPEPLRGQDVERGAAVDGRGAEPLRDV